MVIHLKRKLVFFALLLSYSYLLFAQPEKRALFSVPNTASLGIFGQIPTDHFTGLPQVNIPIYEFKSRDLSVPFTLSYHAGSVKPSTYPGWVGLGWNLQAGGVITRIQNDLPDEYISYTTGIRPKGFFYFYNALSGSNWADANVLNAEFDTLYGNNAYKAERRDKAPDEFQFNFLGMSGSLFMGQDGKWKLKTNQGLDFLVEMEVGPYALREAGAQQPSMIKNCITRFTLTAGNGTKYVFGDDKASITACQGPGSKYFNGVDSNAIEFNRMGVGGGDCFSRDGGTVPTSWYLTKIISITGDEIKLEYKRYGYQVISTGSSFGSEYNITNVNISINPKSSRTVVPFNDQVYIVDPVFLSKISGANGYVEFNNSKANILDYQLFGNPYNFVWQELKDAYYYEVFYSDNNSFPKSTWMKLDEIVVKNNNNQKVYSYAFNYNETPTDRLYLSSIKTKDAVGNETPPYSFQYYYPDGLNNVPYSTLKVDHAGYYNGVDPVLNLFPGTIYYSNDYSSSGNIMAFFPPSMAATYTSRREPVQEAMKSGILKKIVYPTSGNTEFIYESHNYSKAVKELPLSVEEISSNKLAGGLRIKKIISQADFNAPTQSKEYFYVRDYVNNDLRSSGVLNGPEPKYVEDEIIDNSPYYTLNYRIWSSNYKTPNHFTNGSHVNYTSVTEVNADGGFTIYNFSNQDNGYLNKPHVLGITTNPKPFNENAILRSSNLELERGLLLSEKIYRKDTLLLKKVDYEYNNDASRFNVFVKRYYYDTKNVYDGSAFAIGNEGVVSKPFILHLSTLIATQNFIHYPFLKKITETLYNQNGGNPIVTVTDFTYDQYRNLKSEVALNSKNEAIMTSYNYANDDVPGLDATALEGKNTMVVGHIVSIPLEKTITRNNFNISRTRTNYKFWGNAGTYLVRPVSQEIQLGSHSAEKREEFNNYDLYGNITSHNKVQDYAVSYQWGYKNVYPIAKVINAKDTYRKYTKRLPSTGSGNFAWGPGVFTSQTTTFNHVRTGNITIAVGFGSGPANGMSMLMNYTLKVSGAIVRSGTVCVGNPQSTCSYQSSVTYTNMPAGTYTLDAWNISDYSIGATGFYSYESYNDVETNEGLKGFFHTSFEEEDGNSTDGDAKTGRKSKTNGYTKSLTDLTNGSYLLTYWQKSGGIWNLQKSSVSVTANAYTINLTGQVDEVRLYPTKAQMTTYTYDPLIGMTSACDINNRVTYYEYDRFGRLLHVRDEKKNILKKYCYNYQGQPVSCN